MDIYNVIKKRRSVRQFAEKEVPRDLIEKCLDVARLAPSAGNKQPLEYIAITDFEQCQKLFPLLGWAGYLKGWSCPEEKQPRAYIVIAVDSEKVFAGYEAYDVALAAGNISLLAQSENVGSCLIGNYDKEKMCDLLNVPEGYSLPLIVALGYPAEEAVVEELTDSVKYWRDEEEIHHVPKRSFKDIVHWERF